VAVFSDDSRTARYSMFDSVGTWQTKSSAAASSGSREWSFIRGASYAKEGIIIGTNRGNRVTAIEFDSGSGSPRWSTIPFVSGSGTAFWNNVGVAYEQQSSL
jgi:hypothetical protein